MKTNWIYSLFFTSNLFMCFLATNFLDLQNSSSSVTPGKNIESPNIGSLIYVPAGSFQRDARFILLLKPYYLASTK